jgi:hypothetical protein
MLMFFACVAFVAATCVTIPSVSLLLLMAGVGSLILDHFI